MLTEYITSLPQRFSLYLVRHATPDWSRRDIPYHVPPGPELTEKGHQEAAELAEFLSKQKIAHILASPLERAWRTACYSSELSGAPLEQNVDLSEFRPGETDQELVARVQRALLLGCQLSAKNGPVALVSHGACVLAMLKLLGLPAEIVDRSRIYDSRNILPPAGAWHAERLDCEIKIHMAFVPQGARMPVSSLQAD